MKNLILVITLLTAYGCCYAGGDDDYAVSKISPALIKDVNVVVRKEEQRFEIKSLDKAVETYKVVYTIFNENGDDYANLTVPYDRFNSIDYIDGNLYDANGKKIKSVKRSDISDKSHNTEFADDSRYKEYNFYYKVYPYTVEFEYSLVRKQTMFLTNWYPQDDEDLAVEKSNFSVTVPSEYQLRYKMINYKGEPVVSENGGKKTFQWDAQNLVAIKYKFGWPGWRYVAPMVIIAPSDFQIEDYKGSMLSWQDFGKFQLALNAGQDVLPDDIKAKVHQLTDGKADLEKVHILYDYLQKNTRYVSIQLGIGGWRPFPAADVAKRGYGDCKGLSNYMHALLKEAGVNSYYTLILAGEKKEDILTDFPKSQFNHVIVCVPIQKDTLWLECTNQTDVLGFMGDWTGNRHALLITEDGGKLVSTRRYTANDNQQMRKVAAKLNADGSVNFQSNTDYLGTQQELYHAVINTLLSKEKVNEFLQDQIDLATFDVLKYDYNEDRSLSPKINEKLDVLVRSYAQVTGKRIFLNPNILNRLSLKLPAEERTYPIWIREGFIDKDTITVEIPSGYKPEALPSKTEIKSAFGTYEADYQVDGDHVYYVRRFEGRDGIFPKESYGELVKFYEQVYKADRNKIVLVKNE